MRKELLTLCVITASELKEGMMIINLGYVKRVDVYSNCVLIFLECSCLYELEKIPFRSKEWVRVISDLTGEPKIYE